MLKKYRFTKIVSFLLLFSLLMVVFLTGGSCEGGSKRKRILPLYYTEPGVIFDDIKFDKAAYEVDDEITVTMGFIVNGNYGIQWGTVGESNYVAYNYIGLNVHADGFIITDNATGEEFENFFSVVYKMDEMPTFKWDKETAIDYWINPKNKNNRYYNPDDFIYFTFTFRFSDTYVAPENSYVTTDRGRSYRVSRNFLKFGVQLLEKIEDISNYRGDQYIYNAHNEKYGALSDVSLDKAHSNLKKAKSIIKKQNKNS